MLRPGERKEITGAVLGSKLSVPSDYANRLRAGIHKLRLGKVPLEKLEGYLEQLEGNIAYVKNINPDLARRLLRDLEIAKNTLAPTGGSFIRQ